MGFLMSAGVIAGITLGNTLSVAQAETATRVDGLEREVQRNDSETKQAVDKVNDKVEVNGKNIVKLLVKLGVEPE